MLIRLFGQNFRSFKNDFELSMVAADLTNDRDRDRGVFEVPITGMPEPLRLLRTVAIFGPNASGKSTAILAAQALRWMAIESSSRSKPDAKIPVYEPFLLDEESRTAPIRLGCDVVYKNSVLRYEIEFDSNSILSEKLSLLSQSRTKKLITRSASGEVGGALISKSEANKLYVKAMQPNVTVLSKLAQHGPNKGPESVQPFYKVIRNATRNEDYSSIAANRRFVIGSAADDKFADDDDYRKWIMSHLILPSDVGIYDVSTRRESLRLPNYVKEEIQKLGTGAKIPDTKVVVSFKHSGASSRSIDFEDESIGTKKLFHLASDWWALANKSATLFADELSASLHPKLLERLIASVNESKVVTNSQLIFTTHDAGLLESHNGQPPALRRDQVYFVSKNSNGESELYSLAEFKNDARSVHNIRKRYLSGLYGAIPAVEGVSL